MKLSACRWFRSRLSLLAGGDLVGPDRRLTERHLVGCPDCRHHLEVLRGALRALHAAAEVPAASPDAPSLWPDLARQIRESRRASSSPWLPLLTSPAAALAATLLLTVGTAIVWPLLRPDEPTSIAALTPPRPDPEPRLMLVDREASRSDRDEDPSGDVLVKGPSSPTGQPFDGDPAVEARNTH